MLLELGFKLNHNVESYIYKAPVQYYIPLNDKETGERLTADGIIKKCEKGVRYSVRIGDQRGLVSKIVTYDDIKADPSLMDDFMEVMGDTSERNDFMERNAEYCTHLMEVFRDYMDLSLVYYDKNVDKAMQDERDAQTAANLKKMETCNEKQKKKLKELEEKIEETDINANKQNNII